MQLGSLKRFILSSLARAAAVISIVTAAKAQDAPMRIAFPSGMNGQIVVTMEKAGITKKNGLNAQFNSFQYGPPMMEALAAGSIDAVVTSLMPITSYATRMPGDIRIVASLGQSSHSLMVGKDSTAKAPADLSGRKLGVSFGSDSHLDTLVWLKESGLAGKVALINVAPSELATALTNSSVDAIVIRQPQVLRLQQLSGARILHTWPFRFVSIVKSKFAEDKPEAVTRYLQSLRESLLYIAQNKDETAKWFGEYLRVDPAIVKAVSVDDANYNAGTINDIDISITPRVRSIVTKWIDDAVANNLVKSKPDIARLLP